MVLIQDHIQIPRHDTNGVEECLVVSKEIMESPITELPLDPTWGLGEYLSIGTEAKVGRSWGDMH